jgi:hypothetical protein
MLRLKTPFTLIVLAALGACGGDSSTPQPDAATMPLPGFQGVDDYCPGSPHCPNPGDGTLYVGVDVESINPTLVETEWTDTDGNHEWTSDEPFVDTNANGEFDATWMAGFGNGRAATDFHNQRGLSVRAIAFKEGETTVVIAILDVVGYFIDDMDLIKADPALAGLDIDHIIIGSTHVHEAVDTVGLWGPTFSRSGLNPDYQALTHTATAQAIKKAFEGMKPAHMAVAQKQTIDTLDGNTHEYVGDGRDPMIYDPTMTIIRFTEATDDTKTIATLINWAAHPEYSGSRNNLLTADYVDLLREYTEAGVPDPADPTGPPMIPGLGGTTVFVQGACGGQIGPSGTAPLRPDGTAVPDSGLEKADVLGNNLAIFALGALDEAQSFTTAPLSYRTAEVYAQVDNTGYHALYLLDVFDRRLYFFDETKPLGGDNTPWVRTRETFLQIGPVATITAPGELHPELFVGGYDGSWSFGNEILPEPVNAPDLGLAPQAPYLRDLMLMNPGVQFTFVSGLSEDFLGYIVASFNYVLNPDLPYITEADGEHYEETNSIGPLVEEQIQHPMMELAKWRPE